VPNNGQKLQSLTGTVQRIVVVINLAFSHIYPPVFPHIAMENPPFEDVFPIREKVIFQPAMLVLLEGMPHMRSLVASLAVRSCLDPGARCFADSDVEIRRGFSQVFRPLKLFFPGTLQGGASKAHIITTPKSNILCYYV